MKQSFSSYQMWEESDHSSYFDERLIHQNVIGMFSDSSKVLLVQDEKSEETFSHFNENFSRKQALPPFKVKLV